MTGRELERPELSERRRRHCRDDLWIARTAAKLGLAHTIRRENRPGKSEATHA